MDRRKILVIRLSAVGDVIRTLPAVKALKEKEPSSHIAWVVEEHSKSFLESQPEINEVILFPRKRWTKGIKSPLTWWRTAREVRDFTKGLRQKRFDVALDFHGMLKSGLISFVSGAPTRIGFGQRSTKEGNFLFCNVRVELPRREINRYERNLLLLRGIGLEVKEVPGGLHIPPDDREEMDLFFGPSAALSSKPLIAIHPGTSVKTPYKRWMQDRYSQLADRLIRELESRVIFTWGPDELEWVEEIRKGMKGPSMLGPRTKSLTQLGEVYRRCNLYIGGDTGPMHVASLVGTPIVAIWGPTHPVVNEPFGKHIMVRKEVGCNPCRKQFCKEVTCLTSVTVEDVFQAARELLSVGPEGKGIASQG